MPAQEVLGTSPVPTLGDWAVPAPTALWPGHLMACGGLERGQPGGLRLQAVLASHVTPDGPGSEIFAALGAGNSAALVLPMGVSLTLKFAFVRILRVLGPDGSWQKDHDLCFVRIRAQSHAAEQIYKNLKGFLRPFLAG